jgi:aconitase A
VEQDVGNAGSAIQEGESMKSKPRETYALKRKLALAAVFVVFAAAMAGDAAPQLRHTPSPPPPPPQPVRASSIQDPKDALSSKQKRSLRKDRFNQMKEHADELAGLANSLHEDLENSNENVLSLDIIEKAKKIEKLAKKIREEAKTGV